MGKYLKVFDLTSEYQTYVNGPDVILPNVSKCKDDNTKVYYNPYVEPVDPYNGHEYVEIGGLKWATMNVGANSITDYGLYFQWGDTQGYTAEQVGGGSGKKYFSWGDYKYCNGTSSVMTKYNSTDGKIVLDLEDDAAQAYWSGEWRMPTVEEFQALGTVCSTAWTTDYQGSGVSGLVCTVTADTVGKGETLFFPAAGYCGDGGVSDVGSVGRYWSSSLDSSTVSYARYLFFGGDRVYWGSYSHRSCGYAVRGVVG